MKNNSWEIEWNKLTVKSYNLKTEKYEDEPIIFVNDKSWKIVKDFISQLLKTQREEIIKYGNRDTNEYEPHTYEEMEKADAYWESLRKGED